MNIAAEVGLRAKEVRVMAGVSSRLIFLRHCIDFESSCDDPRRQEFLDVDRVPVGAARADASELARGVEQDGDSDAVGRRDHALDVGERASAIAGHADKLDLGRDLRQICCAPALAAPLRLGTGNK